ncbi:MAG: hypothetical protein PHG00_15860 [Methylococcales bacterium]|nr:hypothetical protein [Methylococcales bacterium]
MALLFHINLNNPDIAEAIFARQNQINIFWPKDKSLDSLNPTISSEVVIIDNVVTGLACFGK